MVRARAGRREPIRHIYRSRRLLLPTSAVTSTDLGGAASGRRGPGRAPDHHLCCDYCLGSPHAPARPGADTVEESPVFSSPPTPPKLPEGHALASATAPARPRIILLDVDGTLVTYTNMLPDSAVRAVRRARAAGHRVYVTTGRSRAEVPERIWSIGLDGMIGGNGAYVEDDGEVLLHRHLSRDDCARIVAWLRARGLTFYLESNSGLYAPESFPDAARDAIRAYAAGKGHDDAASLEVADALPDLVLTEQLVREDVNKISFVLSGPQDIEAARQAFPGLLVGTWGGRGHAALFGDLALPAANKVDAIDVLLRHLGASPGDAVAFGDGAVDVGMLRHCGVGVAMGNAAPGVKAAADLVTDDVEDDGLARAFTRLGLIEEP
ncbi:Cof-type HAD-IIB family hydrolase [Actinomyces sp. 432]|nr:Cof-type HAD-IIB family hydrolase [Actinomyces sp. 565]QHO90857.1 Cof-type HAD-IIB family hydrolase [Actinomyces sp. 432]